MGAEVDKFKGEGDWYLEMVCAHFVNLLKTLTLVSTFTILVGDERVYQTICKCIGFNCLAVKQGSKTFMDCDVGEEEPESDCGGRGAWIGERGETDSE